MNEVSLIDGHIDNEIKINNIKIGDICTYRYPNLNKSLSVVEVVEELSDEFVVVKFHQVIFDDSGNDYFNYLLDTGKTMSVSRKYLTKIDLIHSLKADNKELKEKIQDIRNETAKEFKVRLINNIDSGELYMSNDDYWMTIEHINRVEQEIINSVNETEESK